MKYSPQQQAFVEWVKTGEGSCFVEAVAGSGKTTTLLAALKETTGTVVFCAYNNRIVREIETKVAKLNVGSRVTVATIHSLGNRALTRALGRVRCDKNLKRKRVAAECYIPDDLETFVYNLVSLAKQRVIYPDAQDRAPWRELVDHFDLAYELTNPRNGNRAARNGDDIEERIEQGIDYAMRALRYGVEIAREVIDFDDMIYLPIVLNIKLFENDWVFVDEAQDTNPGRRMLVRKMLKQNGRSAWVGDRHQAIYGFTGADADAIDQIVRDFNCTTLPLTVTFRCPKAVVAKAQEVVQHIQAADTAPDGIVRNLAWDEFQKDTVAAKAFHPTEDAILCRNTKPLVELAYVLIRNGVACHVEGRDIGQGLINLVNRYKTNDIETLRDKLEAYLERETAKLMAKGQETKAEALKDRVETIFVIIEAQPPATTVDELRNRITNMFIDSEKEPKPTLTLSTVHKSKGREWKRVFLLGRNKYMPSSYARQPWQKEQENNLIYVAYTRAMHELALVSVAE